MNNTALVSFLTSISLTENQICEIVREYPNIIEICKENRIDEIDLSKLRGIGPYIIEVIKRKINSNVDLADISKAFGGLISIHIAKGLKQKYFSLDKIIYEMNKNPYKCLCSIDGVSFKTADSILLKIAGNQMFQSNGQCMFVVPQDFIKSKDRCIQVIIFLLKQNEINGNTKMNIDSLKKQVINLTPECFHHLSDMLLPNCCPQEIYIDIKMNTVARSQTYFTEKKISNHIFEAIKLSNKWNLDTDKYFKIKDFTLTKEQAQTLNMVCKNNISILTGSAGTGKSSSTVALLNMLKDNKKSFVLAAPTGMAAKIAGRYTNVTAFTIHKLLGFNVVNKSFTYDKNNKLPYDTVIIDEISMCDIFLFCSLLEAIDFKKTKLLLIGNSAQLPSVSAGNILYDLVNSKSLSVNSLTKVFRTGEGGILTAATYARMSKSYLDSRSSKNQTVGKDKSYVFIPSSSESILEKAKIPYSSLLEKGYSSKDILVLSAYNKGKIGTHKINEILQPIANPNSEDINKSILAYNFDGTQTRFYVNDLIIQTKNNYRAISKENNFDFQYEFIPNGEIGIIKNISEQGIEIEFENTVLYQKEDMKNLKLAYSISVHKSQGGCAKIVILLTPSCHTFMLNSNLLYVGITRAIEKVYHLGDPSVINKVIHKKVDIKRETALLNMMRGEL